MSILKGGSLVHHGPSGIFALWQCRSTPTSAFLVQCADTFLDLLAAYPLLMDSSSASTPSKTSLGDLIAEATLSLYASLTPSPRAHLPIRNGALEWTILSSVSLVLPPAACTAADEAQRVILISLGTGTKTTPYENIKGTPGDVLHDLHAEVLARRGARRWLAQRIAVEARWTKQRSEGQGDTEAVLDGLPLLLQQTNEDQRWQLREGIKVWWYFSTLPCKSQFSMRLGHSEPAMLTVPLLNL